MSDDTNIDADELLQKVEEGERELMEMIDSPEDNTEEIKYEVATLARIAKKTIRTQDELLTRLERVDERVKERSDEHRDRTKSALEQVGLDTSDDEAE